MARGEEPTLSKGPKLVATVVNSLIAKVIYLDTP